MTDHILERAKAYAALIGAVLTVVASQAPSDPTVAKWLGIAVAICTAVTTYALPNKPAPAKAPKAGRHQAGNVDVLLLLSVLTFVGVLLLLFRVHFR